MKQPPPLARLLVGIATMAAALGAMPIYPADLSPGDTYRYIFVTYDMTDAYSANIDDYNNVVANEVAITPDLFALGTTWKALASTPTVNALANAGLSPADTTTRFYNVLGELIAVGTQVSVTGLYGGWTTLHTAPILRANGMTSSPAWTGTRPDGTTGRFSLGSPERTGECYPDYCYWYGTASTLNGGWTYYNLSMAGYGQHLYGVSGELTATAETPEPATLTMILIGVLALTVTKRKHRCLR